MDYHEYEKTVCVVGVDDCLRANRELPMIEVIMTVTKKWNRCEGTREFSCNR